jgi:hypothetical protein
MRQTGLEHGSFTPGEFCHRHAAFRSGMLGSMSKTLLYSLAAIADIVIAILAYRGGRVVIPVILVLAGFCFAAAAIGSALGKGGPKQQSPK